MNIPPSSLETLIFTQSLDTHPIYISAVLDLLGVSNEIVVLDTLLSRGGFSLVNEGGETRISVRGQGVDTPLKALRSVWNRRRPVKFVEPDAMHPADLPFLESSGFSFAKSVSLVGEELFSVNPARGILYGGDKFSQMRAARDAGFYVPRTRITNDAASVREFLAQEGRICVKAYSAINWLSEGTVYAPWTTELNCDTSLEDGSIEICPMIYQSLVPKIFEVRMTVFGSYCSATRINSQQNESTSTDWRKDLSYLDNLEDIQMPDAVIKMAKSVLAALGLRFGTFDLAFNDEYGWIFFEVNESGQFLWQEQFCDEARVCEPFARFLASCDENFIFDKRASSSELGFCSLKENVKELRQFAKMESFPLSPTANLFVLNEDITNAA